VLPTFGHFTRCLLLALLLWLLAAPAQLLAHGPSTSTAHTVVQTLGEHELTVTLQPTGPVPGPLQVTLWLRGPQPAPALVLRAASASAWPTDSNRAVVRPIAGDAGPYNVQLWVDQPGPWELELAFANAQPDAPLAASVPFTVVSPALVGPERDLRNAFAFAGVLLSASLLAGWRGLRQPGFFALAGAGAVATLVSLSVAATLAWQQSMNPSGMSTTQHTVPHVNAQLHFASGQPMAGQPAMLELLLNDGATGQPVDDLALHHDALIHLIVVSSDGAFFAHMHPARIAQGRYAIRLSPDRPGQYRAYIELVRRGGGTQLLSEVFVVGGVPVNAPEAMPGLGTRSIDGLTVTVSSE
jgi:hypothetical protein